MSLGRRGFLKGILGITTLALMPKTVAAMPKTAVPAGKKIVEHWFPQAFPETQPGGPSHTGVGFPTVFSNEQLADRFMGWLPAEPGVKSLIFEKLSKQLYPDLPFQRLQWLLDRLSKTDDPVLIDGWHHHAWCLSEGVQYDVVQKYDCGSEAVF